MIEISILMNELCYEYSCEIKKMLEKGCTKDDLTSVTLELNRKVNHLKEISNEFNEIIETIKKCSPKDSDNIDGSLWFIFKNNLKKCLEYNNSNLIIEIIEEIYSKLYDEIYKEVYNAAYRKAYSDAQWPIREIIQYEIDNDILKSEEIDRAIEEYQREIFKFLRPRINIEYINSIKKVSFYYDYTFRNDITPKIQDAILKNIKEVLIKNKKIRKNIINGAYKELLDNLEEEDFDNTCRRRISKSIIKRIAKLTHLVLEQKNNK